MSKRLTTGEFISKAKEIHGDKYDYSKVEYVNAHTPVCIICPEHGQFLQMPSNHLKGRGCSKCSNNRKLTLNEFIEMSKKIYGDKYDYSKVNYINALTKVCIICPEHGEFWTTPNNHLRGHACPICKQSKLERDIEHNISNFIEQKTFDWLKDKSLMKLDFYLPDYNIVIECQGEQHFNQKWFGCRDISDRYEYNKLINTQNRDILKYNLCKQHNIEIIYYFPKRFIKYNVDFYKDKICFHNINDLKKYLETKDL